MTPPPPLCPDGHVSSADDYCDVCGTPIQPASVANPVATEAKVSVAAGSSASDETSPQAEEARICPHCGAPCSPSYLFCEDCGYDFTTGALPRPLSEGLIDTRVRTPESASPPLTPAPTSKPAPPEPSPVPTPGPTTPQPTLAPTPEPTARPQAPARPTAAPTSEPATPQPPAQPERVAAAVSSTNTSAPLARPANQAPSRRASGDWVVEVWIDPAWYEVQESGQACPSPAVPDVVTLSGRALVGRYSASRQIVPAVDCGSDSGVSRRHAEFTTDGRRWWVEDLGSSNGTFVGPASGPLPTDPLPAGQRVEVDDDDRIYVGAWTRLVLRPATASEIAGQG